MAYRLLRLIKKALTVRSFDLRVTRSCGVSGPVSRKGSKFRIACSILVAIEARVLIKMPKQFSVAVTYKASLQMS